MDHIKKIHIKTDKATLIIHNYPTDKEQKDLRELEKTAIRLNRYRLTVTILSLILFVVVFMVGNTALRETLGNKPLYSYAARALAIASIATCIYASFAEQHWRKRLERNCTRMGNGPYCLKAMGETDNLQDGIDNLKAFLSNMGLLWELIAAKNEKDEYLRETEGVTMELDTNNGKLELSYGRFHENGDYEKTGLVLPVRRIVKNRKIENETMEYDVTERTMRLPMPYDGPWIVNGNRL